MICRGESGWVDVEWAFRLCWRMRFVSSDCQLNASGRCLFRPFLLPTLLQASQV